MTDSAYTIKQNTVEGLGSALDGKAAVDLSNLSSTGEVHFQAPITGAASLITTLDLTASKALVSDANGKVAVSSVTSTELGYISGVTSSIQTQINGIDGRISSLATVATSGSYTDLSNTPTIPTVNNATLTIQRNGTTVNTFTANSSSDVTCNISVPTQASDISAEPAISLTASRALVSNSSGKVTVSSVTSTELGYVSGVTSAIQTQLNAKQTSLVSGTNIKTINGSSVLGSGNLTVSAGADTDLSNVTSTGKLTAMGWNTPDYSSGIQFSVDVEYSCPSIGVIVVRGVISNNYLYPLQINGNSVAYSYNAGSAGYNGTYSAEFIVSKGDKIIINDQLSGGSGMFYPMKGV